MSEVEQIEIPEGMIHIGGRSFTIPRGVFVQATEHKWDRSGCALYDEVQHESVSCMRRIRIGDYYCWQFSVKPPDGDDPLERAFMAFAARLVDGRFRYITLEEWNLQVEIRYRESAES